LNLPGYDQRLKDSLAKGLLTSDTSLLLSDAAFINPFTGTLHTMDSLISLKHQEQTKALELKFRIRQYEDSTTIAKAERKIAQDSLILSLQDSKILRQDKTIRNFLIVAAVLIAFALFIAYYIQRKNRKAAETQALRERTDKEYIEYLKHELDHRVENMLATIMTIIERVRERTSDQQSITSVEEQVRPMVLLSEILRTTHTEDVDLQNYFSSICAGLKATYDPHNLVTIAINTPMEMDGGRAGRLGLILNELVTNSFKHAFPDGKGGSIDITCIKDDAGMYRLSVTDSGPGIKRNVFNENEMGLELVKGFAHQLKAEMLQRPSTTANFEFIFM
jgi:two-component sensor histidine kinase